MLMHIFQFGVALLVLLAAAQYFTKSAEMIGQYFKLPSFIIGVFIVGIGTSLPELVTAVLSVVHGQSEIVAGNIMGANIANILLITGMVAFVNQRTIELTQDYIFIDLHYLIGAFILFAITAMDGQISSLEAAVGLAAFASFSLYVSKGDDRDATTSAPGKFPASALGVIGLTSVGIYFGAEYTVDALTKIAIALSIPSSIVALTVLSVGTTLPELAVSIAAIREGNAEMAVGNVLGSCIFNSLVIPFVASLFGTVVVTNELLGFSLPVMMVCGLFFYLVTHDKKISKWEGLLFIFIYVLFLLKVAGVD